MVRCKRIFGLGMAYAQALILALPYSVDSLLWHVIIDIIEGKARNDPEESGVKEVVSHGTVENIKRSRAIITGAGRLTCMFVIQKVNNKFLLLCVTCSEVIFLLFAHTLYAAYGSTILAWGYLVVIYIQGTRFPFSINILSKWTITRRMTSLYCAFEATKVMMLSFMILIVSHFRGHGRSSVLVHVYCAVAIKLLFCVLWTIFGAADPVQSMFVSTEELNELRKGNPRRVKTKWKNTVPWRKIFATPILYGCVVFDIGNMWMHEWEWSDLTEPFQMYVTRGSVVALVFFYVFLSCCLAFSFVVDYIMKLNITTVNNIRKTTAAITSWGAGVCFILIGYTLSDNRANPVWVAFYQIARIANFYNDSSMIVYALSSNYFGFNYAFVSGIAYFSVALKDRVEDALAVNGTEWVLYYYGMMIIFSCLTMLVSGDCHPREFDSFGTVEWKDGSFVSFP